MGQCSKGNTCSFWHDTNKCAEPVTQPALSPEHPKSQELQDSVEAKSPRGRSPSGRFNRMPSRDHLKGTCANPLCEKWHSPPCSFYKLAEGCKFGDKCSFAHRRFEEQPNKRPKRSGDKSAVALLEKTKNLGILRKSSTATKPIRCVRFTIAVLRNAKLRYQNLSLNTICHGDSHQCSPNAPKFQDRSQEQTEWQEHWAGEAAWRLAKNI